MTRRLPRHLKVFLELVFYDWGQAMTTQFECVNCGRIYNAIKVPKCPVCSASGPIISSESTQNQRAQSSSDNYSDEQERQKWEEQRRKANKPSWGATILWYAGVAFVIFIVLGFLTDGYGSGGGNVPGKECFDYEMPNGDWANSCDQ
jgi:hypothetical protein